MVQLVHLLSERKRSGGGALKQTETEDTHPSKGPGSPDRGATERGGKEEFGKAVRRPRMGAGESGAAEHRKKNGALTHLGIVKSTGVGRGSSTKR